MKRMIFLFLLMVAAGVSALFAQDYSYHAYRDHREKYAQPLSALIDEARADLGIEIAVDPRVEPYLAMTVPQAPWKYWDDPTLRLAYMLAPLDLTFEKTGEKSYRIFEPFYQQRPEAEGAAQLKRLLKRFPDRAAWESRKATLRKAMLGALQLDPMPPQTPLHPISTETYAYDGYTVTHIALEVIPKYWLCGSLYRPTQGDGPFPLVASPHGHGKDGRLSEANQLRAATLARMGAIVFSYSMFAWIPEESPLTIDAHRNPISGTMQTLGTFRVLDYLTSLDGADSSRIGITGASGGGTQTFLATALDDRITVSVPVVMVSSHFFGGCPCESGTPLHTLCGGICNAEIAAMAAPRPQLLVAVTQDWTKNTPEVEYPYLRTIYSYYDAADAVEYAIFDEPHDYGESKRKAMYPFLAKHLGLDLSQADESKVTIEPREQMLPFGPNRERYPADAVTSLDDLLKAFENCKK